jgi:hypothetical protein
MEAGAAPVDTPGARLLKPLDVGQLLDTAIGLYTKNATQLWTIVAAVVLPLQVIWVIVSRLVLGSAYQVNGLLGSGLHTTTGRANVINILLEVVVILGSLLATGAVFKFQLDAYLGRPHSVDSSFRFAFAEHRVLSLLWISILSIVLTVAGLILLILGSVWVWVSLAVAIPVLFLEGTTGFAALARSFELVRGFWWATFGRLLVTLILLVVVYFVTNAIGLAIANSVSSPLVWLIVRAVFFSIGAILFAPFYSAVINVLYVDLRVRKEGLDHPTLVAQLETPSGPPPGVEPLPDVTPSAAPPAGEPPASQPPPSEPPPAAPTT